MTDKYHQFDSFNTLLNIFVPELEKIWAEYDATTLKGAITSFPYERKEVEQVLTEFKDAGGKIVRINNNALFRRCSCVGRDGIKRVCVPPKVGWMCERRAIMVRKHLLLESSMIERRRKQVENARVQEAIETAQKETQCYLESEEGKYTIMLLAEQRLNGRSQGSQSDPLSSSCPLSLETLNGIDIDTLRSSSQWSQQNHSQSLGW